MAALELRIRELEIQAQHRAAEPRFEWKSWAGKYGLLVAWVVIILVLGSFISTAIVAALLTGVVVGAVKAFSYSI